MDIESFYEQNPRRRDSAEIELGHAWHSSNEAGVYQVSWIEDTGEIYAMREPQVPPYVDPFGGVYQRAVEEKSEVVEVLGIVSTREELEQLLLGWQEAMDEDGGLEWVKERLSSHRPDPPDDTPPPVRSGEDEIPAPE